VPAKSLFVVPFSGATAHRATMPAMSGRLATVANASRCAAAGTASHCDRYQTPFVSGALEHQLVSAALVRLVVGMEVSAELGRWHSVKNRVDGGSTTLAHPSRRYLLYPSQPQPVAPTWL